MPSAIAGCRAWPCRVRPGGRGAFAREPPQHRIDEAGKVRAVAIGLRQPHREIDRGMIGHIEKRICAAPDQQRGLDARRVLRQAALQQQAEEVAQACRAAAARSRRAPGPARGRDPPGRQGPDGRCAPSSCSSSGRRRRSTPSRMSAAMRRAARPGGSVGALAVLVRWRRFGWTGAWPVLHRRPLYRIMAGLRPALSAPIEKLCLMPTRRPNRRHPKPDNAPRQAPADAGGRASAGGGGGAPRRSGTGGRPKRPKEIAGRDGLDRRVTAIGKSTDWPRISRKRPFPRGLADFGYRKPHARHLRRDHIPAIGGRAFLCCMI